MQTERIIRRKLSDEVLERLLRLISEGNLKPGDAMPSERELMERFGVGRPGDPRGDAVARQHGARLHQPWRARAGAGTHRAVDLPPGGPVGAYHAAALLRLARTPEERAAVLRARHGARSCGEGDAGGRGQAPRHMEEQRGLLGKAEDFMAADMRFHTQIAAISGNPIFISVSEAMLGWLKAYHTELLIWSGKENPHAGRTHGDRGRHCRAMTRKRREAAMARHLQRSSGLYGLKVSTAQPRLGRTASPSIARASPRWRGGGRIRRTAPPRASPVRRWRRRASFRPSGCCPQARCGNGRRVRGTSG